MKLFLFATFSEAEATLKALQAKPVSGSERLLWPQGKLPSLYSFEKGWIALSGIGLHAAQLAFSTYAPQVEEVWNFGLAGCLHSSFPLGSLHPISTVGKYVITESLNPLSLQFVSHSLPSLSLETSGVKLISSDAPLHTPSHRKDLGTHWDLVDMEGYGIAYAAHHLEKKCYLWKIVSDFVSPEGRKTIQEQMRTFSQRIAEKIVSCV